MSWIRKVVDALARAWRWLLENPIALAAMLGAVVGAWFTWKRATNKIDSLEDAVAVEAAKRKIAKSEARAELLESTAEAKEPEAERLRREAAETKRRIVEIHEKRPLQGMTDEEVAELFRDSGL